MVNPTQNKRINQELKALYKRVETDFLDAYEKAFGSRYPGLHDFGIIDEESYDAENGILIVMKEGNNWEASGYDSRYTYLDFARDMRNGAVTLEHGMQTWYNLGRYIAAVRAPERPTTEICALYGGDALSELRHAAVTNLNKATGYAASGKEYYNLLHQSDIAIHTFTEEVNILQPKTILFCLGKGETWIFEDSFMDSLRAKGCTVIDTWHPGARKSTAEMIDNVKEQLHPRVQF